MIVSPSTNPMQDLQTIRLLAAAAQRCEKADVRKRVLEKIESLTYEIEPTVLEFERRESLRHEIFQGGHEGDWLDQEEGTSSRDWD